MNAIFFIALGIRQGLFMSTYKYFINIASINNVLLLSGSRKHPLNMEVLQHEYLNNSLLLNFTDKSCNNCGKEGNDDLLIECIMFSAVEQWYKPAATLCLKYVIIY